MKRSAHSASRPLVLLAALGMAGCIGGLPRQAHLPDRNAVVLDQLVVHSDFPLPRQHRLLDDVRLLRHDVASRLCLPASDEPIHVYLFESDESFKGYVRSAHPEFPVRRAFFVESDTRLAVYAQWGDRVAEDLRHEVAHGYLHSVVRGIPLWLDEGLAEYFEVPRGQAGRNQPHVDVLLGRLLVEGWRPNLERLENLTAIDAMSQEDYAESWAWIHFMLEGEAAEHRLLQGFLESLRLRGAAVPLSHGLKAAHPHPEQWLSQHLYAMAEAEKQRPAVAASRP